MFTNTALPAIVQVTSLYIKKLEVETDKKLKLTGRVKYEKLLVLPFQRKGDQRNCFIRPSAHHENLALALIWPFLNISYQTSIYIANNTTDMMRNS